MNTGAFLVCLAVLTVTTGCARELDRVAATESITKSQMFSKPEPALLVVGDVEVSAVGHDARYSRLIRAGYATGVRGQFGYKRVSLTPVGLRAIGAAGGRQWGGRDWAVPIGTPELLVVQRVSTDGATAIADFDWKWKLTPLGEIVSAEEAGERHGRAFLRRYDDGWRVDRITEQYR